jgi:uncharacterized protein YcgL (UPF0745 family)
MSVKIITYDLRKPGRNYDDLIEAIRLYKNAKLTESFWFINTDDDIKTVYDNLNSYTDKNDRLLILNLEDSQIMGKNLISTEKNIKDLF